MKTSKFGRHCDEVKAKVLDILEKETTATNHAVLSTLLCCVIKDCGKDIEDFIPVLREMFEALKNMEIT